MSPLLSLSGDLSKVQWPAALQSLDLMSCGKVHGTFQPRLASFVRPTNTIEHLSCGPSRKTDLHPAFFRPLFLLALGPFECFLGDISAVKWPEGLQTLSFWQTSVSGTPSAHFCRFYAPGELSCRAAPAATLLIPPFVHLTPFLPQVTSARSNGLQLCRRST